MVPVLERRIRLVFPGGSIQAGRYPAIFSTGRTDNSPAGAFASLNPSWRSSVNVQFSQPLGQGRGRRIQLLPTRLAQNSYDSTRLGFQASVQELVRQVETSYWGLVFSARNVEVRRKDVEEAHQTYVKELEKASVGESSRPEVAEAKLSFYRNLDLLQERKTEALEEERLFRALLGLPGFDDRRIVVAMPDGMPRLDIDWEESARAMLEIRPDIIAQRLAEDAARLRFDLAENQLKPNVNFESSFGKSGFDSSFDRSLDQMVESDDYNWRLGITALRNVNRYGVKAAVRRACLVWGQQKEITRQLEYSAMHALQSAYTRLQQKMLQVQQMVLLREAANERYEAYREKFELGELAIELYIRAQAANSDAQLQEQLARVEMMQAATAFEFARGTLLNSRSIDIGGREPRLTTPKPGLVLDELPAATIPPLPRAPSVEEMLEQANPRVKELMTQPHGRPIRVTQL